MPNILDSFRLDNKIALVTGSAGGMGAAIAIALAEAGATIATHDIKPPADTVATIEAAGGKAAAFTADLSDTAAPDALFKQVLDKFGRVDILVNNAGIILREDAVNVPLADWLKVIQINETAVFQLSQLAGRDMMTRNAPGKIINIASLLSFQGGIRVPVLRRSQGRRRPDHQGARQRVGRQGHPGQRHRPRLHRHQQHRATPRRPGPQQGDPRPHPRRTLGRSHRRRRHRRLPRLRRSRLHHRPRAGGRWRLDGALADRIAPRARAPR